MWINGKAVVRVSEENSSRKKTKEEKMQAHEKVEKSRLIVFFQWFVAPEGRKVGSLKWQVRGHPAR